MGQILAADRLWQHCKTEFAYWLEDDWLHQAAGYIGASFEILKKYPEIITVSLRGAFANGHPLTEDARYPFRILQPDYHHFGCFTFNPGLRRLSDYKRIGTYGKYCGYHVRGTASEQILSDLYQKLDYLIASLPPDSKQIVEHLGHCCSKQKEYPPPPPKILIAIPACHQYRYGKQTNAFHNDAQPSRIDAQRKTWLKDVIPHKHYVDYKFFYGRGAGTPQHDEVFLECGDTYEDLPSKVKEICRYALTNGYTHVYKCDDDTYCRVDRLLLSDFRSYDQYGFKFDGEQNYVTGGAGYTLSQAAMKAVIAEQPNHWAEDLWVGSVMRKHNLKRGKDLRFVPGFREHYVDITKLPEDFITCHAVKPQDMETLCQFLPLSVNQDIQPKSSSVAKLLSPDAPSASIKHIEATSQKSQHVETPRTASKSNTVKICSGLGNQMFMYAFGEGLGNSTSYFFEDKHREFELQPYGIQLTAAKSRITYKESKTNLLYDPKALEQPTNSVFEGCWQNEQYFAHIAEKIRDKFTLNFPHLEPLAEKLAAEESVAVHVRRGDVLLPEKRAYHGLLGKPYYSAAYAKVRERIPNAKFYVFSDDPDWCRENMEGTVLEGNQYEDLYLFSKCRSAIIANSTYSWWGAWLGNGSGSVIAPRQWFNKANVSIDIVPERWTKIESGF